MLNGTIVIGDIDVSVRPNHPCRPWQPDSRCPDRMGPGRMIMASSGRQTNNHARRDSWRRQIQRQQNIDITVADLCRQLGYSVPTFFSLNGQFALVSSAALSPTAFA